MTAAPTAARLLVDCLAEQGCERVFTVPGESFLPVLDALYDTPVDPDRRLPPGRRRGVHGLRRRHYDRAARALPSSRAGPARPTPAIGVHVAFQDSQPMILFIGDVARSMRDREGFQEVDLAALFAPTAKSAARIDDAARIPEYIARAYATAISGRPGPVVLVLPEDMLYDAGPRRYGRASKCVRPAQAPCPDALSAMMALLADAAAPVGDRRRRRLQRQGAALLRGPSPSGSGCPSPPRSASRMRFRPRRRSMPATSATAPTRSWSNGSRRRTCYWSSAPASARRLDRRLLADHARSSGPDADPRPSRPRGTRTGSTRRPRDLRRHRRVRRERRAVGRGDVDPVRRRRRGARRMGRMEHAGQRRHRARSRRAASRSPATSFPADSIICNGAGNFSGWWHRYWRYEGFPRSSRRPSGAMGYGVPAAVAAALRFPERQVLAVAGDGDFLMNGQELATAVQYGCDLLVHRGRQFVLRHDPHAPGARVPRTGLGNRSGQSRFRRARRRFRRLVRRGRNRPTNSPRRLPRRRGRKGVRG